MSGQRLVRLEPTAYGRATLKGFAERGLVGKPAHNMWREKSTGVVARSPDRAAVANHDSPIDLPQTWAGRETDPQRVVGCKRAALRGKPKPRLWPWSVTPIRGLPKANVWDGRQP